MVHSVAFYALFMTFRDLTVTYNEPKTTAESDQISCIHIPPIKLHVLGS